MDVFHSEYKTGSDEHKDIAKQIDEQEKTLSTARRHFMMEDIDAGDFKALKAECGETLRLLEGKLATLPGKTESLRTVEVLLDIVCNALQTSSYIIIG